MNILQTSSAKIGECSDEFIFQDYPKDVELWIIIKVEENVIKWIEPPYKGLELALIEMNLFGKVSIIMITTK